VSFLPLDRIWADSRFDPSHTIEFSGDVESYNPVREGDLLVPKVSPTFAHGRTAIASGLTGGRALATSEVFVLRPDDPRDAAFLRYRLISPDFLREGQSAWHGVAGLKRVSGDFLMSTRIATRAWRDRHAIADLLDRECERIGGFAARSAGLRAVLARAKATVSTSLFMRHAGDAVPLWAASDPARPIMYGIVLPGEHVPDGVPVVKGGDVENGRLLPPLLSRTTAAIDAAYARARLRRGDVLVTIRGSYGATAVVPPELEGANITQDTARVAPRPSSADGQWLWLMLCSAQVRDELSLVATGATIKGVNIRDLKRIRVPIPSLGTQRSEVAAAMASLGRLRTAQETAERLTHALTAYRSSLIHEAVTGKLDVTAASDRQMDERLHAAAEGRLDEVPV